MKNTVKGLNIKGLDKVKKAVKEVKKEVEKMNKKEVITTGIENGAVKRNAIVDQLAARVQGHKVVPQVFSGLAKEVIIESFKTQYLSGNLGVGVVSNANSTIISLMGHHAKAKKALIQALKIKEVGSKKYIGLKGLIAKHAGVETDDIKVMAFYITSELSDELISEMKRANLNNKANIDKILYDLNVMYRMYQELTIDAAKKVYKVTVKVMLQLYRPYSLQPMQYKFDYDKKEFSAWYKEVNRRIPKTNIKMQGFYDNIALCGKHVMDTLEGLATSAFDIDAKMPAEEIKRLNGYKGLGPVADLLGTVKYAYAKITAKYAKARQIAEATGSEAILEAARNARKQELDMLSIVTRQLLDGFDANEKASIMQVIACKDSDSNRLNPESSNQIATSLLTEEFLTMVLENHAEIKVCGYDVLIDAGLTVGSKVEFFFGISENGSLLDAAGEEHLACGEFEIIEKDGRMKAVKPIEFNVPEADYTKRAFAVKASPKFMDLIKEHLTEGKKATVDAEGLVTIDGVIVGEIKYESTSKCKGKGNRIEDLLSVTGTIEYVSIITDEEGYTSIMFQMGDVETYEDEANSSKYEDDIEDDLDDIVSDDEDAELEENASKYDDDIEFDDEDDDIEDDFEDEDEDVEDDLDDEDEFDDEDFEDDDEIDFEDDEEDDEIDFSDC